MAPVKLYVLLDEEFNIIGTAQSESAAQAGSDARSDSDEDTVTCQLSPRPGQRLIEMTVSDRMAALQDGARLQAILRDPAARDEGGYIL